MLNYEVYKNNKSDKWIVFIHGIGGSILTWKKQIEPFSENYNLLALDLPGHGKSQEDLDITVKSVNKKIKEVLDYENIMEADFIGMSMGSLVIAHFAIKYPEIVRTIILGGSIINIDGVYKWLMNAVNKTKLLFPKKLLYNTLSRVLMPKKNHEKSRRIFIRESLKMKREAFLKWLEYSSEITHAEDLIEKLKELPMKILLVSGDEDICFLSGTKKLAKEIHAEILTIAKCGHVCTIEKYREFNKMALQFLEC